MADKKKRLGKGLNSLLSSTRLRELDEISDIKAVPADLESREIKEFEIVKELSVDEIQRNPYQPRRNWDDDKLKELAESINVNGLIQPILVRPLDSGYQLIAGERRLKAIKIAGKEKVPAIIRRADEEQVLEWALIENIHRSDLSPIERARAYQQYVNSFSLTQQEVAQRLGEDRSTIANYMRLLELPAEIQQLVADEKISMGHARALLAVSDKTILRQLAEETVIKNLSVREIERRVRNLQAKVDTKEIKPLERSPNIVELEQQMSQKLGTKVMIKTVGRKGHRGKIVIEFYNLDDFDRIKEIMRL